MKTAITIAVLSSFLTISLRSYAYCSPEPYFAVICYDDDGSSCHDVIEDFYSVRATCKQTTIPCSVWMFDYDGPLDGVLYIAAGWRSTCDMDFNLMYWDEDSGGWWNDDCDHETKSFSYPYYKYSASEDDDLTEPGWEYEDNDGFFRLHYYDSDSVWRARELWINEV